MQAGLGRGDFFLTVVKGGLSIKVTCELRPEGWGRHEIYKEFGKSILGRGRGKCKRPGAGTRRVRTEPVWWENGEQRGEARAGAAHAGPRTGRVTVQASNGFIEQVNKGWTDEWVKRRSVDMNGFCSQVPSSHFHFTPAPGEEAGKRGLWHPNQLVSGKGE